METTIMENQMENTMENDMETTGIIMVISLIQLLLRGAVSKVAPPSSFHFLFHHPNITPA